MLLVIAMSAFLSASAAPQYYGPGSLETRQTGGQQASILQGDANAVLQSESSGVDPASAIGALLSDADNVF